MKKRGPLLQPVSDPALAIYFVDGRWHDMKPGDPCYFLKSNGETVGIIHLLAMHYLVTIDMAPCGRLDLIVKERS